MNIVVLAGGLSHERDVSLCSGSLVANALKKKGHDVLLLDLYEGYKKRVNKNIFKNSKEYNYELNGLNPDLNIIKQRNNNQEELIGKNVIKICKMADIVFLALHGSIGENGTLQAVFDLYNIKYTGTHCLGSVLAMNKDISKHLVQNQGINTAQWFLYNPNNTIDDININYPLVVKPCSSGSSVGVYVAQNKKELEEAINKAQEYEEELIIEKYLEGREFSVGVLGNQVLPPIEIIPIEGFYDYKNKYQKGLTNEICPANLSKEAETNLKEIAYKVFKILKLKYYARIDFILHEDKFYFLEANTLPGMTPTSLLPQEAAAININFNDLCESIVNMVLK